MSEIDLKLLSSILDLSPFGLSVYELLDEEKLEFRYVYVNQQQCKISGFNLMQLTGSTMREAFPALYENEAILPNFCLNVLKEGQEMHFGEYQYEDENLELINYDITCIPLSNTLALVRTEDKAELKVSQAEFKETNDRLKQLNHRLKKITDTSPEIIYVYNLQKHRHEYINESVFTMLGYKAEEVIQMGGENFSQLVHPEDRLAIGAHLTNVLPKLSDHEIVKVEYRLLHKITKEYIWFQSVGSLFEKDEFGKVKTTIGISRNINKEKEALQNLEQANQSLGIKVEQLSDLNEELKAFNYSVSHDLRQPVRGIHGLTQLLQDKLGDKIKTEESVVFSEIQRQTQRMEVLISDLLKYAQFGNESLNTQLVNMEELCKEAFYSIPSNSDEPKPNLLLDSIPNIYGDPTLLASLWANLFSNAIKYRSMARVLNITVGAIPEESEKYLTYFVRDNGIGFEKENAEKIFKLFERLDINSPIEGTGIGLSIANKIVKKHKGRIWAESKLDKGTTFYFSIPVKQENNE